MIDVLVVGGIFREILAFDTMPVKRLGGSGLTAATAARHLGVSVALAGVVGSCEERAVRELLHDHDVEDHVLATRGRSGTFAYPTSESQERPWPLYRPAEDSVVASPRLPRARVILLFGIPDLDPVAAGWVDGVAEGATIVWDRQGWLSRARDDKHVLALRALRRIYLATPSEAAEDVGADEPWAVVHQPAPGYSAAIIKRGVQGVTVCSAESDPVYVPAFPVSTRTAIGSGDAFAGALAAAVSRGTELVPAAQLGCAVAAAMIQQETNLVDGRVVSKARELVSTLVD